MRRALRTPCEEQPVGTLNPDIPSAELARALDEDAGDYLRLYEKGRSHLENELWNGEYFHQAVQWKDLRAASPLDPGSRSLDHDPGYSPEATLLLEEEGPKYQYGDGCLSDGVLGDWLARVCGIGEILDPEKVRSHLLAVHRYNLRHDLSDHGNPQRSGYAFGNEGGLLLCSWPRGGAPSLPFVYSNEVWSGIEYQVASHLMMTGHPAATAVPTWCTMRVSGWLNALTAATTPIGCLMTTSLRSPAVAGIVSP